MTEGEMKGRTKEFALQVIRTVGKIPQSQAGSVLGKQLIRSATSVGANYRSACRAKSKADFVAKLAIAEEDADESQYWLELLSELNAVGNPEIGMLIREAEELTKILVSSGKTAKENLRRSQ